MIVYDSHKWFTFWSLKGSIFPKAVCYALPSTIGAFLMKHYEVLGTKDILASSNGTIYSGFTFVLGFILVFRTSASYERYWIAATAVHTMRAEWFDACGSLIAFVQLSKCGQDKVKEFTHVMIRLFGLMHAMALEEIACIENDNLPLLDIQGLHKEDLRVLTSDAAQGRKVELVAQWIKKLIITAEADGTLPVPAPILTRVFQELGTGLVHYHEAVQVVIWPFPFPYAQMSAVLIAVYMVVTPLVICLWTQSSWYAAVATLMSVVCMKGIDLIAMELENPFGDDANDLPTFQMHHAMNRDLVLLANPQTWTIPRLKACAITDYRELVRLNKKNQKAVVAHNIAKDLRGTCCNFIKQMAGSLCAKAAHSKAKTDRQNEEARQDFGARKSRTCRVLGMKPVASTGITGFLSSHLEEDEEENEEEDEEEDADEELYNPFLEQARRSSSSSQSKLVSSDRDPSDGHARHGFEQDAGAQPPEVSVRFACDVDFGVKKEPVDNGPCIRQPSTRQKRSERPEVRGPGLSEGQPWSEFLRQLSEQWHLHLNEQLAQQDMVNKSHLDAMAQLFQVPCQGPAPLRSAASPSHNWPGPEPPDDLPETLRGKSTKVKAAQPNQLNSREELPPEVPAAKEISRSTSGEVRVPVSAEEAPLLPGALQVKDP